MGTLRERLSERFSKKTYPDTNNPETKRAIEKGRETFKKLYLGWTYGWVLNGLAHHIVDFAGKSYDTHHPGDSSVVGTFPRFSRNDIPNLDMLLRGIRGVGRTFFETVPWRKRVELLVEISKVVEERFWLLVAAKQWETGQSLMEAIGETDEEVDFPLAIAMYLEELNGEKLLPSPPSSGDHNGKRYVPHGVFLNISPFNFPGAIPMDMACKALAMGNAFIEKSSDKSSLCGYLVYESITLAFDRLGIPHKGVANYAPGGPEVVDMLLTSPDITGVSFTGSSDALASIKEKHGTMLRNCYRGRASLAFASAETSGVNIVVVWRDADLKRAAKECVKAFVGRSGQKCSSARVIMAHTDIQEEFSALLRQELNTVRFGDVFDGADLGPVITPEAERVIRERCDKLLVRRIVYGWHCAHTGYHPRYFSLPRALLVESGIVDDEERAREFMNTEIFGPVTSVIGVSDIEAVRTLCELSDFALTGACFTADMDVRIALSDVIPAGNLYHNRKCTGALVETECFGGLRSRSSPSGIKGKNALALFGSMQTISGFYDPSDERDRFVKRMEDEKGFVFSKT